MEIVLTESVNATQHGKSTSFSKYIYVSEVAKFSGKKGHILTFTRYKKNTGARMKNKH